MDPIAAPTAPVTLPEKPMFQSDILFLSLPMVNSNMLSQECFSKSAVQTRLSVRWMKEYMAPCSNQSFGTLR